MGFRVKLDETEQGRKTAFETYRCLAGDLFETVELDSDRPFRADVRAWQIGPMFLHHGLHPAISYQRDRARARKDGLDDYGIFGLERGELRFSDGEKEGRLRPGEVLVIHRSRPITCIPGGMCIAPSIFPGTMPGC